MLTPILPQPTSHGPPLAGILVKTLPGSICDGAKYIEEVPTIREYENTVFHRRKPANYSAERFVKFYNLRV